MHQTGILIAHQAGSPPSLEILFPPNFRAACRRRYQGMVGNIYFGGMCSSSRLFLGYSTRPAQRRTAKYVGATVVRV